MRKRRMSIAVALLAVVLVLGVGRYFISVGFEHVEPAVARSDAIADWEDGRKDQALGGFVKAYWLALESGARWSMADRYIDKSYRLLMEGQRQDALSNCRTAWQILGDYDTEGGIDFLCTQIEDAIKRQLAETARLAKTPSRLEDTQVEINDVGSFGQGIAWSHRGDRIAYFYGESIWTVRVDQWDQLQRAYDIADYSPWSLPGTFLAWSPSDAMIGVNLRKDRGTEPAEWYIGQIDWRRNALSFLAPEQGMGSAWSSDNRMAGYLDWDLGIYDIQSLKWQPLAVPERFASYYMRPTGWTSDNQLLLVGLPELDYKKDVLAYTVFLANLETGWWDTLPVQAVSTPSPWPPQPVASADGRWIAWIEDRFDFDPRTWRIMLYDRTQAQLIEAASSTENSALNGTLMWESLTWSPDSKRLAFSATRVKGPDETKKTMWFLHLDQSP